MKFILKDYQSEAVRDVLENLIDAKDDWHGKARKSAFSLTAVTGAGKTVMAAAAFEALFHGDEAFDFEADPYASVIWFSDDPSLNEQTRFRLMESSDRINYSDMIVVENTFNQPKLQAGKIYFLNTQKLGKNSLLVRGHDQYEINEKVGGLFPETRPDMRAYTIWDTIRNTIEDPERTLYLVLDEAHRGVGKSINEKGTIVQRLINGFDDIPGIPVVWGISATVERFDHAIENAVKRTKLPNVVVDVTKVQESGLIKDTVLIDIPDEVGDFDTVLVRRATDKLIEYTEMWNKYSKDQGDHQTVIPLMVLQVPNTPDHDDIGRTLDVIYERYPDLAPNSVAHVFGDHVTQKFGSREVPYIQPQKVQDSTWVRILIAKDAISSGWDCPRAEVMISFRAASDKTHITQLLGRMIRSPLARRIPSNERLNAVDCLLPKFNKKTVDIVIDEMMHSEDGVSAMSGRFLVNPVQVLANPEVDEQIWQKFEQLPTQTRPQKSAKPAKRLTALAQELADDGLLEWAGNIAHTKLHEALDNFQHKFEDKITEKRKSVLVLEGTSVIANMLDNSKSFNQFWEDADLAVIDDTYRRAERIFTADIARTYVDYLANKKASLEEDPDEFMEAISEAKVIVAALGLVTEIQGYFDDMANSISNEWMKEYWSEIRLLNDNRQESYKQIIEMSKEPQSIQLVRPTEKLEPTSILEKGSQTKIAVWKDHLLCDKNGDYPANLNSWEKTVIQTEAQKPGFKFWYRNPQQPGQTSLGIAYRDYEDYKIMRPDFIFFCQEQNKVVADIVDPHSLHLSDALNKLKGLADYAEQHIDTYRRIESIAEVDSKLRAIDLKDSKVRELVSSSSDARAIFRSTLAKDYK